MPHQIIKDIFFVSIYCVRIFCCNITALSDERCSFGLPAVYQVYRREALCTKGFRRFLFAVFGRRSTKGLPRRFFEGETRGVLPLFCVLSTFWSMQGALCCHSWWNLPFSSSLREFLPCFGRKLSSVPEFKRPANKSQVEISDLRERQKDNTKSSR